MKNRCQICGHSEWKCDHLECKYSMCILSIRECLKLDRELRKVEIIENKKRKKEKLKMEKTLWQEIYSFFGFWFYYTYDIKKKIKYKVLYWCCLPWWKYFRKFDLVKIRCGKFEKEDAIFVHKSANDPGMGV